MEVLFNWCCEVMQSLANFTGFTYKEVNVIVFIFLMPMVDIALLLLEKADIEHQNGDGDENLMAVFYKQILHSGRTLLFSKEAPILPQTFILDVTFQTPTNTAGSCGG